MYSFPWSRRKPASLGHPLGWGMGLGTPSAALTAVILLSRSPNLNTEHLQEKSSFLKTSVFMLWALGECDLL